MECREKRVCHHCSLLATITVAAIIVLGMKTAILPMILLGAVMLQICAPGLSTIPLYVTASLRISVIHIIQAFHYVFVDKIECNSKLSQKQLNREGNEYLFAVTLHLVVQLMLQILFPGMFLSTDSTLWSSGWNTVISHVLIVEPIYYVVHRWLHNPNQMKAMHSFHHLSIKTVPSTSLVQNHVEHIVYVATFGPAMLLPYFVAGFNDWRVICAYLVLFDIANAYGHCNVNVRHWLFQHPYSPIRYLVYTPQFHRDHHMHFNCNYSLFMPVWDHLFGTYCEHVALTKPETRPSAKDDFVFIGHNGGLGHYLTIPEFCFYNVYDVYRQTGLGTELELLCAHAINNLLRTVFRSYSLPRYQVDGEYTGRVMCIMRTPLDFCRPAQYADINAEIVDLIRAQNQAGGTRYFGLGNLNKMKQLNDGGADIVRAIKNACDLKNKSIRIWTGDTLTVASVYKHVTSLPGLEEVFYIGAGGKVGQAVCEMLLQTGISVRVFSEYQSIKHSRMSYTNKLADLSAYKYVVIGKSLSAVQRRELQELCSALDEKVFLLDYSVPFAPLQLSGGSRHVQIGVLKVTNESFLRGYYDICMGLDQGCIYPCHAGCLLNMVLKRETDEVGAVNVAEVEPLWIVATSCGLENKELLL